MTLLHHGISEVLALRGWGAKSSAAVLAKFVYFESIPSDLREWHVNAANASALRRECDYALLFPSLATLRTDLPLFEDLDQLRWRGATPVSTSARHDWMPHAPKRADCRIVGRRERH